MTIDEAISTLMENICMSCAYDAECMDKCDIRGCDNRDAIKVIIGETEQHRWIPVTERLPEEYASYYTTIQYKESKARDVAVLCYDPEDKVWLEIWGCGCDVVAWMPLPMQYEGE